MNAQDKFSQIARELEENLALKGLTIISAQISGKNIRFDVYGFNQTADWKKCREALTRLEFACMPNGATLLWNEDTGKMRN